MSTEEQQMQILNFQAITGVGDLEYCQRKLEQFNWNFEQAVMDTLEGSPVASEHSQPSSPTIPISTPNNVETETPSALSKSFHWLVSLITFFAQNGAQECRDPEVAATKFISNYTLSYGQDHPEFFSGSYSRAIDKAKRDLNFMLVYLHSPEHDDTRTFCETILNDSTFSTFLVEKNFILWGGDVSYPEAYQASDILQASLFPFLALVCLKNGRMQVVHRIEGSKTLETIISELSRAIDEHGASLISERADREEMELSRRIRQEQDAAYRESLRRDQEKERLRREAEEKERKELEKAERKERERLKALKNRELMIEELKKSLPPEPTTGDLTKIVFRLPDGSRSERKFLASDNIEILYQYAYTLDLKIDGDFNLCSNFPRKVFDNKEISLREAGLYPNGMLVIEEIYKDE